MHELCAIRLKEEKKQSMKRTTNIIGYKHGEADRRIRYLRRYPQFLNNYDTVR
jgi:hypothetical protein